MNKDALLATLIGFGIGLLITGLLLLGPNVVKYFPRIKLPTIARMQTQQTIISTPTPTPKTGLKIESPLPEAIEDSTSLLVSGAAPGGSTVIIAGFIDESAVVVGSDGKFAGKVTLGEGKNNIMVTSLLGSKTESQTVTVYYTKENL
jgi:hypothetical protein